MKRHWLIWLGLLGVIQTFASVGAYTRAGVPGPDTLSVLSFGAQPEVLATAAIQKAIDACNQKGGGVVLIPAGHWLTGPLVLKSGVNLCLGQGALLQFTRDLSAYPLVKGNFEGLDAMRNQSPLTAQDADHISITGSGIIDGGGDAWRPVKKSKLSPERWDSLMAHGAVLEPDGQTLYPSAEAKKAFRPNLLVLHHCTHVLLEGVTFRNSPAWCLHPLLCRDLVVKHIMASNPSYAQNGDGIDIESCDSVLVEDSRFDVGDDGICLKSGRDEQGRKRGVPTSHVVIDNCTVYHAHGGFVIGSEMSGGVRDIEVYHCAFLGTDVGLRFKTVRGRGGVVENINVHDIYMKDIRGEAILFDMYYMALDPVAKPGEVRSEPVVETLPVTEGTPIFRNFYLHDIVCHGASKALFIRGLPEMNVQGLRMERLSLTATEGIQASYARNMTLKDVQLFTSASPLIHLVNCQQVVLDSIRYVGGVKVLIKLGGDSISGIVLSHTDTAGAERFLESAAPAGALHVMAVESAGPRQLVVDPSGSGNYKTIQEALDHLPDDALFTRVILIKPGIYREKIFVSKNHVALVGEDSAHTIITQAIARDIFRCSHSDDWGVATINMSGSDVDLENLTIANTFGFDHLSDTTVACPDTLKKVSRGGHQMALRTFATTRLRVAHCAFRSFGGDTVSPWNVQDGLFYFKDCTMEGGVDFYCPRGWAYADHCRFIAHTGPACIWHDGSTHAASKTVLRDCTFEGYAGYHLGRYHRDAQFYLVNCRFSEDMADAAIALVPTTNLIQWGKRIYYYNCHRHGGDFPWFADNLQDAPGAPVPDDVQSGWVFGSRWDPESVAYLQ
jgi:pectin methylesterase-like acyl-CoA thioesterase